MFIRCIKIDRLGVLRNLIIDFPKSNESYFNKLNISVIVGENGTGKTTLLRLLANAFASPSNRSAHYNINYGIDDQSHIISNNTMPHVFPNKIIVSTYSPFEQFETRNRNYDYSKYTYVGTMDKNGIGTDLSAVCVPFLESLLENDDEKIHSIRELLDEIGIDALPAIELREVNPDVYFINNNPKDNQLLDKLEKLQSFYNSLEDKFEMYANKMQFNSDWEYKMLRRGKFKLCSIDDIDNYPGGAIAWLDDVRYISNLPRNRRRIIRSLWFPKSNGLIPLSKFSSGELSLFFRFFRMIAEMEHNSLVLIDEPEIHLHPRWIQKYLHMIKEVFGHYKSHFIIATHSPIIVSDVPKECIIGLKKVDHEIIQVKINDQTLGGNPVDILTEVFGLETYLGDHTNSVINKINRMIQQSNLETAEIYYNDLADSEEKFELFKKFKKQQEEQGE